jgi:hypothetical protein
MLTLQNASYKPRPKDLSRLIETLPEGGFVAKADTDRFLKMTFTTYDYRRYAKRTGCVAHVADRSYRPFPCPCSEQDIAALGDQEFKLVWPVESTNESGLNYPLSPFPEWGDAYYELQFHLAKDLVYHTSELIEPFKRVVCACGRPVEYRSWSWEDASPERPVFYDARIYRLCPSCGKPVRPQDWVAKVSDGQTGKAVGRPGGATYLFAIVIDRGKSFARKGWPIRATGTFLDTATKALDQRFYEIGDIK